MPFPLWLVALLLGGEQAPPPARWESLRGTMSRDGGELAASFCCTRWGEATLQVPTRPDGGIVVDLGERHDGCARALTATFGPALPDGGLTIAGVRFIDGGTSLELPADTVPWRIRLQAVGGLRCCGTVRLPAEPTVRLRHP